MTKNYLPFTTLILLVVLLFSCKEEELQAEIPAYLEINEFSILQDSNIVSDNVKDVWIYIDDQLQGVFELPTKIPVLKTNKKVKLSIAGGIFKNSLSNQRDIYPFYEIYNVDTILVPEKVYSINPTVSYRSNTIFDEPWSGEDFESGVNFEHNQRSDTIFIRETNPEKVFNGIASGAAYLTPGMSFFEASTPVFGRNEIPGGSAPVYLELNYRCSHDIVISAYTNNNTQQFSVVNLRAKDGWNKAYIELAPVFSTLFNAANYSIAIGYTKPTQDEGYLIVDDIKLLHF